MLAIDPYFESLNKITEKAEKEAIPLLTHGLQSDSWHLRWQAARLLDALGTDARESVPVLKAKLEDPNSFVRHAAAEALKSIGHENGR